MNFYFSFRNLKILPVSTILLILNAFNKLKDSFYLVGSHCSLIEAQLLGLSHLPSRSKFYIDEPCTAPLAFHVQLLGNMHQNRELVCQRLPRQEGHFPRPEGWHCFLAWPFDLAATPHQSLVCLLPRACQHHCCGQNVESGGI